MDTTEPTIHIFFVNLAVLNGGGSDRLPLSRLDEHSHIHGGLRIQVQGRVLPHLGYFGANDVCFNTWLVELENVCQACKGQSAATYLFDEGEQGQPAFLFEREADKMFLSVVNAHYSGGGADPDWQRVGFDYKDFRTQYLSMKAAFVSELQEAAPQMYGRWSEWWAKQGLSHLKKNST